MWINKATQTFLPALLSLAFFTTPLNGQAEPATTPSNAGFSVVTSLFARDDATAPTTQEPTTIAPTTPEPTTIAPTTTEPTTTEPTTSGPSTPSPLFGTFGEKDDDNVNHLCSTQNYTYKEVVNDEVMQCEKVNEKKCYTSQETVFSSYKTEVCDETYTKSCYISFSQTTSEVPVRICYNQAEKLCNSSTTSVADLSRQQSDLVCVDIFETVCETLHHSHVIEQDVADCVQVSLEVCKTRDGCPTVPKTQCQISKQNVTRAYPETDCKKIKKTVCGQDDCPVVFLPEICTNETRTATSSVPLEKCDLTPKKECRDISSMVPSLQAAEKCINIPKEVCSKVSVPRLVTKVQTRVFCSEVTKAIRGKCTTSNYRKSDGRLACAFSLGDGLTQDIANSTCQGLGARLPEIYSDADNTVISSFLPTPSAGHEGFWLGAYNATTKFTWISTGQNVTYANWSTSEPNNYQENEDCVHMAGTGKWNDVPCDSLIPLTLCEKILSA